MRRTRLIARLDIKGERLIKGVQFEGLRVVGDPQEFALRYAEHADELLYIDTVATLYGRNQLESLIEKVSEKVFIPITVGGGIASWETVKSLLRAGADKVAINTAAIQTPDFINKVSHSCGSQAICVSIEAKRTPHGWEAYTENGRERTGKDAVAWALEAVRLGAGELLLTSVDREGTRRGFDLDLIRAIAPRVPVPVIACGGMGSAADARAAYEAGACIAASTALHTGALTIAGLRTQFNG